MKNSKWSITRFYEESWSLIFKHKALWILGLTAMIYSAGSGNMRLNNFPSNDYSRPNQTTQNTQKVSDSKNSDSPTLQNSESSDFSETPSVSDEAKMMSSFFAPTLNIIKDAFMSVNPGTYLILFLEILFFIIFSVVVGFMAMAWSEVSFMTGIKQAHEDKKVDLAAASKYGIKKIKPFLWISYVPFLKFFFICVAAAFGLSILAAILGSFLSGYSRGLLSSIAALFIVPTFVYFFYKVMVRVYWGKWHCVTQNMKGPDSFQAAIKSTKNNLLKILFLVISNLISGFVFAFGIGIAVIIFVFFIALIGLIIAFATGIFKEFAAEKLLYFLPLVILVLPIFMAVVTSFAIAIRIFFTSVWYMAFDSTLKSKIKVAK